MSSKPPPTDRDEQAAAYLWTFACGHTTVGGNECADACPVCDEPDLVRKAPVESAAQGHEVEGTVPSQWWLDLKVENQRLREALTYYAEGRYPDGGEIAREALAK